MNDTMYAPQNVLAAIHHNMDEWAKVCALLAVGRTKDSGEVLDELAQENWITKPISRTT